MVSQARWDSVKLPHTSKLYELNLAGNLVTFCCVLNTVWRFESFVRNRVDFCMFKQIFRSSTLTHNINMRSNKIILVFCDSFWLIQSLHSFGWKPFQTLFGLRGYRNCNFGSNINIDFFYDHYSYNWRVSEIESRATTTKTKHKVAIKIYQF